MVTRCVCMELSFEHLLALHREHGWDIEALKRETGCCTGCTTCEPYIRLTLRTGLTTHPVLSPREVAEAMRD